MKKKTINELYTQLVNARNHYKSDFIRLLFAYNRAFIQHFGVEPHTKECEYFVNKYGKDYADIIVSLYWRKREILKCLNTLSVHNSMRII